MVRWLRSKDPHLFYQIMGLYHPPGLFHGKLSIFVESNFILCLSNSVTCKNIPLQVLHGAAQSRLGKMQLLGGPGNSTAFCDNQQLNQSI